MPLSTDSPAPVSAIDVARAGEAVGRRLERLEAFALHAAAPV